MINIVIPMAGSGLRFQKAGNERPKPFIDVLGKAMIEHVLENLAIRNARYILILQKAHVPHFEEHCAHLRKTYRMDIVTVDGLTMGSVCTVLAAHRLILNETPMLIANCDQYVDGGIADFVSMALDSKYDGSILTFLNPDRDPKWSYVATNSERLVTQAVEKVAVSDRATVGIYLFSKGRYFVQSALDMIVKNDRSNGEFYTCPVYNYLVAQGLRIGYFDIPTTAMHGLGTPEDLDLFIRCKRS